MDSETLDGRLDIRLTCRSTGILSTKQKRKVPGLCTLPTSACQSKDCVFLSRLNFANLKCQVVIMRKEGQYHIRKIKAVKKINWVQYFVIDTH